MTSNQNQNQNQSVDQNQAADSLTFTLQQLSRVSQETSDALKSSMSSGDFSSAVSTFPQIRSYLTAAQSLLDRIESSQSPSSSSNSSSSTNEPYTSQ